MDYEKVGEYLKAIEIERHRKKDAEAHNTAILMAYQAEQVAFSMIPMRPFIRGIKTKRDKQRLEKYEADMVAYKKRREKARAVTDNQVKELTDEFNKTHTKEGYRRVDVQSIAWAMEGE